MILFRNLVRGVLKRGCRGSRETISPGNLTLNCAPQLRNFYTCLEKKCGNKKWEKCVEKGAGRFCTHSDEAVDVLMEDLSGNLEQEYEQPHEEGVTSEMFEEIAAGDPDVLKKLKLLELEVAVLREEECRVPDYLSKTNWKELLELSTLTKRKKFLSFLRLNELKRESYRKKAELRREMHFRFKEECGFHYYGLSGHTMFIRIYDKSVNKLLAHRTLNAQTNIILDCSYQEYMSMLNLKNCAKQIFFCISEAKLHPIPCKLKLCNFNREDTLGQIFPRYVPGSCEDWFTDIHSESYLDLYPKKKLVYLSPHAKKPLENFSYDDVYIIGAFVDKGTGAKASLAKAKEHNLRMARFPIDEYLIWKNGSKALPLNIVLNILLDMAFYNDWSRAFRCIPDRCTQEN